jgi:hypothetical protein
MTITGLIDAKRVGSDRASSDVVAAMAWWLVQPPAQTIHLRSLAPIQGYLVGIKDGLRKPLVESARE